MNKLEERFDSEIEKRTFTVFEMKGFMVSPKLAIKAGMAIGYKMAIDDIAPQPGIETDAENAAHSCPYCHGRDNGEDFCQQCGRSLRTA